MVGEGGFGRDGGNGPVGLGESRGGPVDAQLSHVSAERHAVDAAEYRGEVPGMHAVRLGDLVDAQAFAKTVVDDFVGAAEPGGQLLRGQPGFAIESRRSGKVYMAQSGALGFSLTMI